MAASSMTVENLMTTQAAQAIGSQIGSALATLYLDNAYSPSLVQLKNLLSATYIYPHSLLIHEFENAGYGFTEKIDLHKNIYRSFHSVLNIHLPTDLEKLKTPGYAVKNVFTEDYKISKSSDDGKADIQTAIVFYFDEIKVLSSFLYELQVNKSVETQIGLAQKLCKGMANFSLEESVLASDFVKKLEIRIEEIEATNVDKDEEAEEREKQEKEKQEKLLALYYLKAMVLSNPNEEGILESFEVLRTTRCGNDEASLYDKAIKHRGNNNYAMFFSEPTSSTKELLVRYEQEAKGNIEAEKHIQSFYY